MAVLDAELRAEDRSFADFLGVTATASRAASASASTTRVDELLATVQGYVDDGYVRIKLKIEPGFDIEPVAAVRDLIGPDMPVPGRRQHRLHAAPTAPTSRRLDDFDLLLIEQPLPEDDILGHARLAAEIATPICLDESIMSADGTRRRDRARGGRDRQHQGRAGSAATSRPVRIHDLCRRQGHPGLVRRDAGDGHRSGRQRRPRRAPRLHAARRHQRIDPLLRARTSSPSRSTIADGHVTVPTGAGPRLRARHDVPRLGHHEPVDLDRLTTVPRP